MEIFFVVNNGHNVFTACYFLYQTVPPHCMVLDYFCLDTLCLTELAHCNFDVVAEWLACWTQAQKGPGSNRSRDAVG